MKRRAVELPAVRHGLRGLVLILIVASGAARALEVGDVVPDWALARLDGQRLDFPADSSGSVSVVLFWATWCPYCRTLMPHLQKLADEFQGRHVRFYALNVWEDGDPAIHLRKHGFTFELLLNAESAAQSWGIRGTPGLFVVGPDGRVLYARRAGEDDLDVEIAMREILKAAPLAIPAK